MKFFKNNSETFNIVRLIIMAVFILAGCNSSKQRVNEKALNTYVALKIKEIDSTLTLEKLTFINLDTSTLQTQYLVLWGEMYGKKKECADKIDRLIEKIKTNRDLQSLASDVSFSLWNNYKDQADDDTKKAQKLFVKDSLIRVDIAIIDSLLESADSVKPLYYVANCAYTIRKKNQSISKDTARIILDLDYNIIDKDEYAKQLNRLYIPISDFTFE